MKKYLSKIIANDNEGLQMISACCAGAELQVAGIKYLQKSLEIDKDPKIAFKIARFAFEDENWALSLRFLNYAKEYGWNETEGRIDLLSGISLYELGRLDDSINAFKLAFESEETKVAAEGWISFVEEIIANS